MSGETRDAFDWEHSTPEQFHAEVERRMGVIGTHYTAMQALQDQLLAHTRDALAQWEPIRLPMLILAPTLPEQVRLAVGSMELLRVTYEEQQRQQAGK